MEDENQVKTYMVKIPAYEIMLEAHDELDAFSDALNQVLYQDCKIEVVD